jgi:dipeptidyl aminopeptidase/acylaminoacyl peptidase
MSSKGPTDRHVLVLAVLAAVAALSALPAAGAAQQHAPVVHANWALADKFDNDKLQPFVYSSAVTPRWIAKTDSAWYQWRDAKGTRYQLLVPRLRSNKPLFDHAKLAGQLSTLGRKPYDATNLSLQFLRFTPDLRSLKFVVDSVGYDYELAGDRLTSRGKLTRQQMRDEQQAATEGGGGGGFGGRGGGPGGEPDFRNFSPDSTAFVFAREHNLFFVEVARGDTVQISSDGVKDYSFGARDTTQQQQFQQQQQDDQQQQGGQGRSRDPRVRANVNWSPDSRAFSVSRSDSRKVKELYLINMLAEPRPTLTTYRYPMPGEENVPQQELHVFNRADGKLTKVDVITRWKDQVNSNVHFGATSQKLRLIRRDRLRQNQELIEVDLPTRQTRVLITEAVEGYTFEGSPVGISYGARYVKSGEDFLWWSERTGWGHFYLYDHNGNLKNAVTSGEWRAESIVAIDSVKRIAWISGVGREPNENIYNQHLYRVNLDGTGLTLLDAGDANHSSVVSPSRQFVVDNYSRPDLVPKSVLRDATGSIILELGEMDLSPFLAMGWKMPETFVVKAADGMTDIYGNMWKPFDFDASKKYPIIVHVYPGPQTENVSNTFSATAQQQRLAQLGFIVVQIGNRGGSPRRSNAYQSYSYLNLRDYGLADKKAGVEQLAARYPWIDLERVGLFGHSGGGFMTAAAMLVPPYNEFFKVGVSSSGNHDNNVYGDYWAEQNHGLQIRKVARATTDGQDGSAVQDTTTRFQIHVPANHEVAANLKGRLLLVHGDMDNNVHPAGTIRLVNALIKANKRFDFMVMPGKPHGYGDYQAYFNRMLYEYFAEHLLGDYYRINAEIR